MVSLRSKDPFLLTNKLGRRVHIQLMSDNTWVNSRHVFMTPCKNINTLPWELDDVLLHLVLHTCSNSSKLLRIVLVQKECLPTLQWALKQLLSSMLILNLLIQHRVVDNRPDGRHGRRVRSGDDALQRQWLVYRGHG